MTAPVFPLAKADAALNVLIGKGGVLRLYLFGEAPQKPTVPYVVWQLVGGMPENKLAGRPDMDTNRVQFDVYAETPEMAREIQGALRDVYEPDAYVVSYNLEVREPDTRLYRFSFSIEFMSPRVPVS